jgi:hypothetical protein
MFPKTPPAPVSEGFSRILFPDSLADVRKLA